MRAQVQTSISTRREPQKTREEKRAGIIQPKWIPKA